MGVAMRRWAQVLVLAGMVAVGTGCGDDSGDSGDAQDADNPLAPTAPASDDAAPTDALGEARLMTSSGLSLAFDVESCTSPGPNIANLQAAGDDGDLDIRVSVTGIFRVTGSDGFEGDIDTLLVEDEVLTASGSYTPDGASESVAVDIVAPCVE